MFEIDNFIETHQEEIITGKIWHDNKVVYLSYYLIFDKYENKSEQFLIKLVSNLPSFEKVPAEYRRQAGIADYEDLNGNTLLELTFVIGNYEH